MKILLAIDGSSFSDAAVAEVARKPWPPASEVKIISVAELPTLPVVEASAIGGSYLDEIEKAAQEQAQAVVNRAAGEIRGRQGDNLRVTTEVIVGYPRSVITNQAEEWGADLIVVGSHGYRGLTKLWLGSVSQSVASHAKCSVEIVRSRNGEARPSL
jgi:nucleotide-binding universal stress UspA family protein